jgi:hypothetical protein
VRQILLEAVRDVPGVLAYPPPDCLIADLTDAAVVYAVRYWLTEFDREAAIAGEVRSRLWYATRRAGLEPAAPAFIVARVPEADVAAVRASRPDDHAERMALLRGVELFGSLTDETRARLADGMRRLDFTAGSRSCSRARRTMRSTWCSVARSASTSRSRAGARGRRPDPARCSAMSSSRASRFRHLQFTNGGGLFVIDRDAPGRADEQPEIAEHLSMTLLRGRRGRCRA